MIEISEAIIRYKDTRTQAYDPLVVQGEIVGELIRCKDCKYWHSNTQFCGVFSGMGIANRMPPNGYCSNGERGTDRDCEHCTHHTEQGCTKWDCEFERVSE